MLAFVVLVTVTPAALAEPRAEFLQLIDRPRVPLAATTTPATITNRQSRIAFRFSAEPGQRVPGILVKPSADSARRPAVIVLHGTGGKKESQEPLLAELARDGFVAVAIDARYHGERASKTGRAGYTDAMLRAFRSGGEYPFFFDTVWDVMRLVDYLTTRDDIDPQRIGLIGFSKGGIETYLTAAVDPRIAVAVPCIGVQSFGWAVEHDAWQSRIGTIQAAFDAAAQETGVRPDADFLRTFYRRIAPGIDGRFDGPAMLPLIAPRPLLSINGDSDARTPLPGLRLCAEAAEAAYARAGAPEKFTLRLQPDTGHKVLPESLVAARQWFVRWLKP